MVRFGHTCVFACDIDANCRKLYETNYHIKPEGDIKKVDENTLPDFDVLCAGFPCQPFSQAGAQEGFNDVTRGTLFHDIIRIVKAKTPKYLILENVKNLAGHDNGKTWKIIHTELTNANYNVYEKPLILNTLYFNVPQNRERVVILCKRKDLGDLQEFPTNLKKQKTDLKNIINPKNNINTSKYAIKGKTKVVEQVWNNFLKCLIENKIDIPRFPIWTDWWDSNGNDTKVAIRNPKLSNEENENIIKQNTDLFYLKYTNWIDKNRSFYKNHQGVLEPWLTESRIQPLWKGSVRKFEWQAGDLSPDDSMNTVMWTMRGSGVRVKRLDYTPTMVAMSMIPVYGPESRIFTPREICRLQSFPENFSMDSSDTRVYKQMGNAVNVEMIYKCIDFLLYNNPL